MIEDLAVTTWSHTSYSDIWPMYFGQFEEHAPFFKHYLMINEIDDKCPNYCEQLVNNQDDPFYKRLITSLSQVEENNIIYMQEDFILYNDVENEKIKMINDFLNKSDYSFIKFMKSGVHGNNLLNNELNIYEVNRNSSYLYSLQACLWKKKDIIKLFKYYRPSNMMQAERGGSNTCRTLGIKGCYIYNNEPKRGNLHWDSDVFPYMSTAVHGSNHGKTGMWQTSLYEKELMPLFDKYNIDKNIRGET